MSGVDFFSMAVSVEMQHTGDPTQQREVAAVIEHMLADRPGDWRVWIVGSQANDRWEMRIVGPNASGLTRWRVRLTNTGRKRSG
jgi:hypothetical protein